MTDKVYENYFDENQNIDENEKALFDNDFLFEETRSADVNKQLRQMLAANDKFDKITDHIINEKRIKMSLLKKEKINLNDVVKWSYAFLNDVIFTTWFDCISPNYDVESIQDEFDYWSKFPDIAYTDDLMTVAFSKHRVGHSGEVRQSIKNLAEWLARSPKKIEKAKNVFNNPEKHRHENSIIHKIMIAYKFDNVDRDRGLKSKFAYNNRMTNFDFDNRIAIFKTMNPRDKFEFFPYFASLQTMMLLAEINPQSQEHLNQLIKHSVVHFSELMTISQTIDYD